MSNYQLRITYFYNIPIGAVKKLEANFFDTESIWFVMKTNNFIRLGLKLKKTSRIRIQSITMVSQIYCTKKARNRKKGDKDGKALYN